MPLGKDSHDLEAYVVPGPRILPTRIPKPNDKPLRLRGGLLLPSKERHPITMAQQAMGAVNNGQLPQVLALARAIK